MSLSPINKRPFHYQINCLIETSIAIQSLEFLIRDVNLMFQKLKMIGGRGKLMLSSILFRIDLAKSTIILRYASYPLTFSIPNFVPSTVRRKEFANICTTLFALFTDLQRVISPQSINEPKNMIEMPDDME